MHFLCTVCAELDIAVRSQVVFTEELQSRSRQNTQHIRKHRPLSERQKHHKMMWKCIARLCTKYKQGGMKDQKAFTGEDLTKLQEKRHGRIDDFSTKQTQYVTHHTERRPDVKRRKLQERQRTKGTRWCKPATQAVTKAKAKARPSNHRSLHTGPRGPLESVFPK